MQGSKIRLSPAEAALIGNAEIILTKNSIIQKTAALLAGLQEELMAESNAMNFSSSPKISKGENYLGLPYVVLDYPRISKGEDLCFIRSMFWWGQFFSSTLQVAGHYKEKSLPLLSSAFQALARQDYYLGINEDVWQHHFESSNYRKLSTLPKDEYEALLHQQPHIKIAARFPLSEWDAAANHFVTNWKTLAGLIA
jgi:hypothetical protein